MVTTTSVFCDFRTTTERPENDYGSVTGEIDRALGFFWGTRRTVGSSLDDKILEWKDRRVEDTDGAEDQDRAEVVLDVTHYAYIIHRKEINNMIHVSQ